MSACDEVEKEIEKLELELGDRLVDDRKDFETHFLAQSLERQRGRTAAETWLQFLRFEQDDVIEAEIAALHAEVGDALFPVTREMFEEDVATRCSAERRQGTTPTREWLSYLRTIKGEKDADSTVWRKMKAWD